ncbi:MAG: sodium-dependent bicarbonate transport family permease [Cyclobacteriaceae bacterium]|nr:sodium-dependent bicarbonate transport family permease [Cyclobacteriaceae bacterium]MCH8517093.1 sodium-dependent bicarbonate transport family permease [Cyclobacteriaceae bacterium]
MNLQLVLDNLTNPALLFFFLGVFAHYIKSDLQIPDNSARFISLYLMFAIGFKGGQELAHSEFNAEIIWAFVLGMLSAVIIPIYIFFITRKRFGPYTAAAVAGAYGSVSAVTFVTTVSFLEINDIQFDGFMVAVMASMEAPSILIALLLVTLFTSSDEDNQVSILDTLKHSLKNGSIVLLVGSLLIGFSASDEQARGIEPFTTDIFKGFLAVFLLDMGITTGRHLKSFRNNGWFAFAVALFIPIINGVVMAYLSGFFLESNGNRLLIAILASSASYIAVPAAMKLAVPQANPGVYLPMALGITFPFNISLGIPIYLSVIRFFG